MKTNTSLMIATAALAVAMGFDVPASQAGTYGNAPWCAVQNLGGGDVVWDCEYRTVEECVPQVLAGNRGFCNVNPRWTPPLSVAPRQHRKRHHA